MSGIYKGPGGQLLHGDGKPVGEPPRPAKPAPKPSSFGAALAAEPSGASPAVREAAGRISEDDLMIALEGLMGQTRTESVWIRGIPQTFTVIKAWADAARRRAALAAEGERPA